MQIFLEWTENTSDLQMVEGADELLELIAAPAEECYLLIADNQIVSAEILKLVYLREENLGGGRDYLL